jgi:hypothetical protein
MPPRLFQHRTSVGGYVIIFFGAVIIQALSYFLPMYFQAVVGASPLMLGVYFLPFALTMIPFGALAGVFMSKTGLYMPLHWLGFALNAVGAGLLSTLNERSRIAEWVCFQMVVSGGTAIIFTATLPSTLAPLPESDLAVATGTYSFIRSFGMVWGVTIAAIVFNDRVTENLDLITDLSIQSNLADGAAYSYASGGLIASLSPSSKAEVINVYVKAFQSIWRAIVAVSCVGFIAVFIEKQVEMRKEHTTEFGLAGTRAGISGTAGTEERQMVTESNEKQET